MGGVIHIQEESPQIPVAHLFEKAITDTQKYVSSSPWVDNINYLKSSLSQIDAQTHLLTS